MTLQTYVITGTASGLGLELGRALTRLGKTVVGVDLEVPPVDGDPVTHHSLLADLADPEDIQATCEFILRDGPVDVLVNCAGLNYLEWIQNMTVEGYDRVMAVNARAPFLMVKYLLPGLIPAKGTVCNVVSNAAHKPMTASLAYNASKGALHIMTEEMARELTPRYGVTVLGVAPHKLEGTKMSHYIEERVVTVRGMTPEAAHAYQLTSLLPGRETPPAYVADFMAWLLAEKARHVQLAGCILPYGI